jgi:hypothetical protein
MAFFDNQDHAGLALLILAIVSIVMAIVTMIWEVVDGSDIQVANIIVAVGTLIGGFLYLAFAQRVRGQTGSNVISDKLGVSGGALNDKFDIICEFVKVFAMVRIVGGVFEIIGGLFNNALIANGVIDIIIGVIALFLYKKITDGKDSVVDKIVWIILLILFLLTIIGGVIALFGIITIPIGICMMIIGVFMFMGLLDSDVKAKFGM